MITDIHIKNYRSFVDTGVKLSRFNLVIGPNGAGKSNFLRAFLDVSHPYEGGRKEIQGTNGAVKQPSSKNLPKHFNYRNQSQEIALTAADGSRIVLPESGKQVELSPEPATALYALNPSGVTRESHPNPLIRDSAESC